MRLGTTVVEGGESPFAVAINNQPTIEGIEDIHRAVRRPSVFRIGPIIRLPRRAPRLIILEKKAIRLSPMSN